MIRPEGYLYLQGCLMHNRGYISCKKHKGNHCQNDCGEKKGRVSVNFIPGPVFFLNGFPFYYAHRIAQNLYGSHHSSNADHKGCHRELVSHYTPGSHNKGDHTQSSAYDPAQPFLIVFFFIPGRIVPGNEKAPFSHQQNHCYDSRQCC